MPEQPTFQIGLCMAGAVSAGAYSAGVMDFLIEALNEWEIRRGQDNVPTHRVSIPVMGGASAGGMTAIITASAINNPISPVPASDKVDLSEKPQNKFYHTWVDLTQQDMFPLLLDSSDINGKNFYSLLNSSFIDKIAQRVINVNTANWSVPPYFDRNLKLFTTLSNLEGFVYNASFKSNSPEKNKYYLSRHNDYACFRIDHDETGYQNDGWIPLNFRKGINTSLAGDAAMATGAFPAGLRARKVSRDIKYVNDNRWLNTIPNQPAAKNNPHNTLNVDGGLINNEPFEKVREILNEYTAQTNPADYQHYNTFKGTVLMIDPFPSEPAAFNFNDRLFPVIGSTLGAMVNHLRIKPETLINAMDSNQAGQYLISPRRKHILVNGDTQDVQGSKAIACGSFDGFGGFLKKDFRIHDFYLGRANCEKFLRDHFTIPANCTNPIFTEGYKNVTDKSPFTAADGSIQIIPVFKKKEGSMPMPAFSNGKKWPSISEAELNRYEPLIKERFEKILLNLSDFNPLTKGLLWIGARVVLNRKIAGITMDTIKKSLKEHDLLEG